MTTAKLTCTDCTHLTVRPRAALPTDAHTVGLARGMLRLRALELELSSREQAVVQSNEPFDSEPFFHGWCAYFSNVEARQWWACWTKNADGLCEANTHRTGGGSEQ
jgi:hypothetical protein